MKQIFLVLAFLICQCASAGDECEKCAHLYEYCGESIEICRNNIFALSLTTNLLEYTKQPMTDKERILYQLGFSSGRESAFFEIIEQN